MTGDELARWLSMREQADARARSETLVTSIASRLPHRKRIRAVDLATGTGANIRYLEPRLPKPHEWLAVDRDARVLEQVPGFAERRCLELGALEHPELFERRDLITASALLDLVSGDWIDRLAEHCRAAGAVVLFALTYDGRSVCSPAEEEDELIRDLFNTHQRGSDKGFGRAAGPDAAPLMVLALERSGFDVRAEGTDWDLSPDDAAIQRELITGWASAAIEVAPSKARVVRNWLARRLAHVEDGRSRIRVGHQDIAGWLR